MSIEFILLIVTIFFVVIYISVLRSLLFNYSNSSPSDSSTEFVNISIVIAAKNEAENINGLIRSLSSLDYPETNYEIIIVDDNSEDDTFRIANGFTSNYSNSFLVRVTDKKYERKRGALDYGISIARYPYIIITDADCRPEKSWLKTFSDKFIREYDFIFGLAPFKQTNSLVNKVSCYENFRNSILSISAVNLGLTYSASARNFGFRKEAFFKIGGYKNTTDSISGDDDLLLREAVKNKLKIGTITSTEAFVYSDSKKSFKEYFSQRARHTQTSFHYPLKQKTFLSAWHTLNIFFLLSPILFSINIIFVVPFIIKMIFDITVCKSYQTKFGYKFSLVESIYLQVLYELFLIAHIIRSKTTVIKWK